MDPARDDVLQQAAHWRDAGVGVIAYGSYLGRPEVLGPAAAVREAHVAALLETPLLRAWADCVAGDHHDDFARITETLPHPRAAAAGDRNPHARRPHP